MTESAHHDGETMVQAKARFWYGIRHPFTCNPLARNRYGWWDFVAGHSTTNLYVTYCRENPREAGHAWRYTVLELLAVIAVLAAGWIWL
jgi:hypothetical protein